MATTKTVYVANDGTLFGEESEALAHDAMTANKAKIDDFIDRHFPIPAPEAVLNDDGSPKLDNDGKPVLKSKQNGGRGPARKAISLWLAENS